jgi:hypothetical protein
MNTHVPDFCVDSSRQGRRGGSEEMGRLPTPTSGVVDVVFGISGQAVRSCVVMRAKLSVAESQASQMLATHTHIYSSRRANEVRESARETSGGCSDPRDRGMYEALSM